MSPSPTLLGMAGGIFYAALQSLLDRLCSPSVNTMQRQAEEAGESLEMSSFFFLSPLHESWTADFWPSFIILIRFLSAKQMAWNMFQLFSSTFLSRFSQKTCPVSHYCPVSFAFMQISIGKRDDHHNSTTVNLNLAFVFLSDVSPLRKWQTINVFLQQARIFCGKLTTGGLFVEGTIFFYHALKALSFMHIICEIGHEELNGILFI